MLKGLTRYNYNSLKNLDIGMNKHVDSEETGGAMEEFLKSCKLESLNLMSCDIGSDTYEV